MSGRRSKAGLGLLALALCWLPGCEHVGVDLEGRPCGADGGCIDGYVCDPATRQCVVAGELCVDADGDDYGDGAGCLGPDCDDASVQCHRDCGLDADGDTLADCRDDCVDVDGDGFGSGGGCLGPDCDEGATTCQGDCLTDADGDTVADCRDDCVDVDGDGFGAGAGCSGPDCDDGSVTCNVACDLDADDDGVLDCGDDCVDADDDGFGVGPGCSGADCDEGAAACNADCATDADGDTVADCRDGCVDADGDDFGAGPGCIGVDCDDGYAACTLDCSGGCACAPGDVVTLGRVAACAPLLPGAGSVVLSTLTVRSTCDNALVALRFDRHPASTTADDALHGLRLFADLDASATPTAGNLQLAGPVAMTGGAIELGPFSLPLRAGRTVALLLVGQVDGAAPPSVLALEVAAAADLEVADANAARLLSPATPLLAGTRVIGPPRCAQAPGFDPGPGGLAVASSRALQRRAPGSWSAGAGDEAGWTEVGSATTATADCDLQTAGTPALTLLDDGGSRSELLHVVTGLPAGLPLDGCSLFLRLVGSRSDGAGCSGGLFGDLQSLFLYRYDDATTVDPASQWIAPVVATAGPLTASGCETDVVDVDITELQAGAGAASLDLRIIPEAGGGIDVADGLRIRRVSEIYLGIR